MSKYRYSSDEKKYITKARSNRDFSKFREQCEWARHPNNQDNINGAILLTRLCGLDFTQNFYYEKSKNPHEKLYQKVMKRPTFLLFIKPFQTCSLKPYEHSRVVIFDIDQRNNTESLPNIIKQMNLLLGKPFYIEYGHKRKNRKYKCSYLYQKKPEGAHLYYQFEDYISDSGLREIENKMGSMGYNIEPIYSTKTIRLPMTYNHPRYKYFGYEVTNHQPVITDKRSVQINKKELKDFFELYKCFRKKDRRTNPIPQWVKKAIDNGDDNKVKKYRVPLKSEVSDKQNMYNQESFIQCNIQDTSPATGRKHILDGCSLNRQYGYGTRHIHQLGIGFDVLRSQENYIKFRQMCFMLNDGTSKDMNLPDNRREKVLESVWDYCKEKYTETDFHALRQSTNSDVYYHDENFKLSDSEQNKINKMVTYYYLHDNWGRPFGPDQKRFTDNVIKLYTEIKQKAVHDKLTNAKYMHHKFLKPLEEGIALSQVAIKRMCKYYKINNPNRLIKFLKRYKFIEPIGIDINGTIRYYSYKKIRYCTHYKVHTVQDRYNVIKHEFDINRLPQFLAQLELNGTIKTNLATGYFTKLSIIVKNIYNNISNKSINISILINNILYKYIYKRDNKYYNVPINNVFREGILNYSIPCKDSVAETANAPP